VPFQHIYLGVPFGAGTVLWGKRKSSRNLASDKKLKVWLFMLYNTAFKLQAQLCDEKLKMWLFRVLSASCHLADVCLTAWNRDFIDT